jgi:hypothetical protein
MRISAYLAVKNKIKPSPIKPVSKARYSTKYKAVRKPFSQQFCIYTEDSLLHSCRNQEAKLSREPHCTQNSEHKQH